MVLPGATAVVALELDDPEEDDDVDVDEEVDNELGEEGPLPQAAKMAVIKITK
jgi:hypothetical protein